MSYDVLEKVTFSYNLFKNAATGYCTFIYKSSSEKITCTGIHLPEQKGLKYNLIGDWIEHPKYGKQFKVNSYELNIDKNKNDIVSYLSSGIIKGIGTKIAEKIYEEFKENSLEILKNEPERLLEVKGITKSKLEAIKKFYKDDNELKECISFFTPYGISSKLIMKIHEYMNGDAVTKIKENPYVLCEIRGITFSLADMIARKEHIDPLHDERILAAIKSVLQENMASGSVGITKEDLIYGNDSVKGLLKTLGFSKDYEHFLWTKIVHFVKKDRLAYYKIQDDNQVIQYFYLKEIKELEEDLANQILKHNKPTQVDIGKIESLLKEYENMEHIILDESQKNSIIKSYTNWLTVTTGGPGTGKTTTINAVKHINQYTEKKELILMAPSGKASRKMAESTGEEASTIHSGLGISVNEEGVQLNEEIKEIENCLVIIDEFSMVDIFMAYKLFKHLKNCRIMLVGDVNQLPSVGPGSVLRDIIESEVIPVTYLSFVHRQDEDSTICINANNIQNDIYDLRSSDDFSCYYMDTSDYLIQENQLSIAENIMLDVYLKDVEKYGVKECICLCAYKEHKTGVYSMNKRIQEILNPLNDRKEFLGNNGLSFRVNDVVLQLKNKDGVCNGDVGTVIFIGMINNLYTMTVFFENGTTANYTKENINEITLGYAMTVHKSQGSEYKSVTFCITNFNKRMLRREILYTAITRAKSHFSIISNKEVVEICVKNKKTTNRNTTLKYHLKKKMQKEENKKEVYEQITLQKLYA